MAQLTAPGRGGGVELMAPANLATLDLPRPTSAGGCWPSSCLLLTRCCAAEEAGLACHPLVGTSQIHERSVPVVALRISLP